MSKIHPYIESLLELALVAAVCVPCWLAVLGVI